MASYLLSLSKAVARQHSSSVRSRVARRVFLWLCSKIEFGSLRVTVPSGESYLFKGSSGRGLESSGEIHVLEDSVFSDALSQGDWGLGWAFVFGRWQSPDPYRVVLTLLLNEHVFRPYVRRAKRFSPYMRGVERKNAQDLTPQEEVRRRTLSEAYDTGNDFFSWMLGPSMQFSCAIWPHPEATLEEAQENKLRLVTEKARIEPHHTVIDLGCGWGKLCDYIQRTTGARVKGIALAKEQIDWAREHYPNCEFEYLNYAHLTGEYDRIVSVGMTEHVGRENLVDYLRLVSDHLKPGGRFVLHSMQSHDGILMESNTARWTSFGSVTMPNGDVPSITDIVRASLRTGSLRIVHTETFGIHYSRTGMEWRKNLERHHDQIVAAYSEELYRIYLYTWCLGSAVMETGMTLLHVVFEKQPFGTPYTYSIR